MRDATEALGVVLAPKSVAGLLDVDREEENSAVRTVDVTAGVEAGVGGMTVALVAGLVATVLEDFVE